MSPAPAAPSVDVSVVTFNSARHLARLVDSLAAQTVGAGALRLTFVDNASTDETLDRLQALKAARGARFAGFEIHANRGNTGFGQGHNAAQRNGQAPFLFVLNPDTALYPDCLARLLADAASAGDRIAAWEPRQIPYEHPKHYDPVSMTPPWCSGAALLLRRTAWDSVGGFDARIFLYCEDVDLSWRLRRAGWELRYVPAACLRHDSYATPGEIKPGQFVYSALGNLYLRTRFGTLGDMLRGYLIFLRLLVGPKHFRGQRKSLLLAGIRYLLYFPWFFERHRPLAGLAFVGLDYAPARQGAFHEVTPDQDIADPPLVSVLIRTIGRTAQLRRALCSVRNQTYRRLEAVVVEDGPATLDTFLDGFADIAIRYRAFGVNRGRCHAGNAAMDMARGEYLCFLDEDDELYADHVEQLVAGLREGGAMAAYATGFEVKTEWNRDFSIRRQGDLELIFNCEFSLIEMCQRNLMPICTVLFARDLYLRCGGFDSELDQLEDWNLWLRYGIEAREFARIEKTTSLYRVPMLDKERENRQQALHDYYWRARAKHDKLDITLRIGDLAKEIDKLVYAQYRVLGIEPHELAALNAFAARRRLVRWAVAIARRVLRWLVRRR